MNTKSKSAPNNEIGCWDELISLQHDSEKILLSPKPILEQLGIAKVVQGSSDTKKLVRDAEIITNDIKTFTEQLTDIRSRHQGKVGHASTPDDLMTALNIGEMYYTWLESFNAITAPTLKRITDNLTGNPVE